MIEQTIYSYFWNRSVIFSFLIFFVTLWNHFWTLKTEQTQQRTNPNSRKPKKRECIKWEKNVSKANEPWSSPVP